MEPITPKKAIKSEPSLFDKVADKAKSVLTKKDTGESSQFNTRKEPTFGQPVTQTLPEQAEFLREVERIRKGDSISRASGEVSSIRILSTPVTPFIRSSSVTEFLCLKKN